ncbi:MAG: DUF2341 domain-containing protein [Patescibacteria group bacterium]
MKQFSIVILAVLIISSLFLAVYSPNISVSAAVSPWTQTDWSGGSGQTSLVDATKFNSSSNINTTTTGQSSLQATNGWYSTSWKYRRKITFDNSAQAQNLTNFPILVKLDSTRIDYSNTQNSGQDIRFADSDGTTLLSHEIESWNESGSSYIWVKIPQVDASSSTDFIYVYYGNSAASDGQAATSVWDSNYKAVWHLKETGNGTANEYVDSTSNGSHGRGGGGTVGSVPTLNSSGQINGAQLFDGAVADDDFIQTALAPSGYSAITMGAWVKLDLADNYPMVLSYGSNADNNPEMRFFSTSGKIEFVRRVDNSGSQDTVNLAGTGWHYLVGAANGTVLTLYKDGAFIASSSFAHNIDSTTPFRIGGRSDGGFTFTGSIDEARVSDVVRSAAWVAASYKSEADTLSTYGSQEERYPSSGTLTSSIFDTEQSSNWGTLTYTTDGVATTAVKARTSNSSSMTGATDFASCDAITSGADISTNNCVTDAHRYVQYQFTLTSVATNTPVFQDISIAFTASDATAPSLSLTALSPDPNNDSTPALTGTATEGVGTVASVEYQADSTAGSWSACVADDAAFDEASEAFTCSISLALSDGSHTIYVRATDSNANTTQSSSYSSDTFTIDATAPSGVGAPTFGTITSASIEIIQPATVTEAGSGLYQWQARRDSATELGLVASASASVTNSGLSENTQYTYDVQFNDKASNTSSYGTSASKYTLADTPTNLVKSSSGQQSITLGVDSFPNDTSGSSGYYFANSTNGTNSGWIQTNSWQNTNLSCENSYNYSVKYRNGDGTETSTIAVSASTPTCEHSSGGGGMAPSASAPSSEAPAPVSESVPVLPAAPLAQPEKAVERAANLLEPVIKIVKPFIPDFLKPEVPKPAEEIVSRKAPLAFRSIWKLLPSESIASFVLAPLPNEIKRLAQKFPELNNTFEEVGISDITDVQKLKTVKLTLPGLTERAGLPIAEVKTGKLALPKGVPLADLSAEAKQEIPSEIIFVKTGGELIDFNAVLSINDQNKPEQKINTISGKPLQLVVKPDKPVKTVKGYMIFKSRKTEPSSFGVPSSNLAASLIFADPVFSEPVRNETLLARLDNISNNTGSQEGMEKVEEELVLMEFEYTDPDGDGIYTADLTTPVVAGEYEIIVVMDYNDPKLDKKEIRLVTVIDPEGYIYENQDGKETRIPGAITSLYWLNPETQAYELWSAGEYQQENPQTTNVSGTYSFLVPEGFYYINVSAPGYLSYEGKPFEVKESVGVHTNIELKTKYWFLNIVDWKTILVIIMIALLIYNFYNDRVREKLLKRNSK